MNGNSSYLRALRAITKQFVQFVTPVSQNGNTQNMSTQIANNDKESWMHHGQRMARALQVELRTMPTGQIVKELLDRQVGLIPLPLEAAKRVQKLAFEAATVTSERAEALAKRILETEIVTEFMAVLIARTRKSRIACDSYRSKSALDWFGRVYLAHHSGSTS